MTLDNPCFYVVREAANWMIDRVAALPGDQQHVQDWPEYAALCVLEVAMDEACLSHDLGATRQAARAYCLAWRNAIQARRANQKEKVL